MKWTVSAAYYERARRVISGGSLTRSKAPGRLAPVGAGPLYALGASGAHVIDVDGNAMVDMVCALGAVTIGHAALGKGDQPCLPSLPHVLEAQAAEEALAYVAPWATSCRFVKTGSEATMAAYLVARAATGRRRVLVGTDSYHGWHGPWATGDDCHRYTPGADWERGSEAFDPATVAAVFVEPPRWRDVDARWYAGVRAYCDRIGALMVLDEMIYGLRWHMHGSFGLHGVKPDLACFGKALGNGAPIACVMGNAALAEHGQLISGTYSGDATALLAALRVLRFYSERRDVVETLWSRGTRLQRRLKDACLGRSVAVEGAGVHQRLVFLDRALGHRFSAEMAARGVLWHPDVANVMYAHTEAMIEQVGDAAHDSFDVMEREGLL